MYLRNKELVRAALARLRVGQAKALEVGEGLLQAAVQAAVRAAQHRDAPRHLVRGWRRELVDVGVPGRTAQRH
ncbi:hypothetical protein ACFYZE_34930 [Streptomyces sp. NPDC001796]|uniref:hypothetical protein n=1 Tax=Streptomyces sp. NPDC001796 TaxID=3364609 RepID=UPI0036AAD1BE